MGRTTVQARPAEDAEFFSLVNAARKAHGLAALTVDRGLRGVANAWSTDMALGETGFRLQHNPRLTPMVAAAYARVRAWGENVAQFSASTGSAKPIFTAYMHSPEHRANILSSKFTNVGIATVCVPPGAAHAGTCFNTMDFGGR